MGETDLVPFRLARQGGLAQDKIFAQRKVWRRGESNPRPKSATARSLHA